MSAITEQLALASLLREFGDPRYGGTLPLGGKPFAGGRTPEMFLTVPAQEDADKGAYDHMMNLRESMMEDLGHRGGLNPMDWQRFSPRGSR